MEQDIACPEEPYTAENLALGRTALERLSCFGSEPITFRGWWPEIPEDAGLGGACAFQEEPSGWLLCQNINYNLILADDTEEFFGIGVKVSIDPSTDASMPERGTWVEVRVHLDDPAAQIVRRGCERRVRARGPAARARPAAPRWCSKRPQAVDGP